MLHAMGNHVCVVNLDFACMETVIVNGQMNVILLPLSYELVNTR